MRVELGFERRGALRLDGGLVHAGGVEVADLLVVGARSVLFPGEPFEDLVERLAVALGEVVKVPQLG